MKAIGIILAGGKNRKLGDLTKLRVSSAIPIASSYRAIDFSLSNMTNSGISKVAVITQNNSRSLNDHLSSSKWWNFGRKQGGLFVFTPYLTDNSMWFRGTADSIYQNLSFLERSNEEFVVITNGDCIYKMDYEDMVNYHIKKNADITIAYRNQKENLSNFGVMKLDDEKRVLEFDEKPLDPKDDTVNLAIYIIRRELLIDLMITLNEQGRYDFVADVIIRYRNRLKIYGYEYNDNYWEPVNTIENFYKINMDFLKREVHDYFNKQGNSILTKAKDQPPVKYNYSARVRNSSIGNGSILSGSVENSVLFRDVRISKNAVIEDSIIMEHSRIGENCELRYVILDKDVKVEDGVKIIGTREKPIIVAKATTVKYDLIQTT